MICACARVATMFEPVSVSHICRIIPTIVLKSVSMCAIPLGLQTQAQCADTLGMLEQEQVSTCTFRTNVCATCAMATYGSTTALLKESSSGAESRGRTRAVRNSEHRLCRSCWARGSCAAAPATSVGPGSGPLARSATPRNTLCGCGA